MNKRTITTLLILLYLLTGSTMVIYGQSETGRVARQVVDLNRSSGDSFPKAVAHLPNTILFLAEIGEEPSSFLTQKQLWRTDGTAAGTYALGDLRLPFQIESKYVEHQGFVYFPVVNEDGINELWRTDGTVAGTQSLQQFDPYPDMRLDIYSIGETLIVESQHSVLSRETDYLYAVDGSERTVLFAGKIRQITPINDNMLFETYNPAKLYASDGTPSGTQEVISLFDRHSFRYIDYGTEQSSAFFFHENVLYATDGTAASTKQIWRTANDIDFIIPMEDDTELNDGIKIMWGEDKQGDRFMIGSDGTAAGTEMILPLANFQTAYDGTLFQIGNMRYFLMDVFSQERSSTRTTLWQTDGTAAGTKAVVDPINEFRMEYYGQTNTTYALFSQYNHGYDVIWRSFGTADSTNPFISDLKFEDLRPIAWNGYLYFFTQSSVDLTTSLWRTDGQNTTELATLPQLYLYEFGTAGFYQHQNLFFFSAERISPTGYEFWVIDLNSGEATKLSDDVDYIYESFTDTDFAQVIGYEGEKPIYMFTTSEDEMWRTDGTPAGTYSFGQTASEQSHESPIGFLGEVDGRWVFAGSDPTTGVELYATVDGSPATTKMIKDVNARSAASDPQFLQKVGNRVCYFANDGSESGLYCSDGTKTELIDSRATTNQYATAFNGGRIGSQLYYTVNGSELWRTNGTKAGTAYTGVDDPVHFFPLTSATTKNGIHFYVTSTYLDGGPKTSLYQYELWRTDGTPSGTYELETLGQGDYFDVPHQLTAVNNHVYFFNQTPYSGIELWKTDGWNTGMVKDIAPGLVSSKPPFTNLELEAVNGQLYFWADDGIHGRELWRSNGTAAGTYMVKDIQPGSDSSWLKNLTAVDNRLFFTPATRQGYELWTSYGTENGTYMVKDINAPWGSADPYLLTPYHKNILFAANDGTNGIELWRSDGTENGTRRLTDLPDGTSIRNIVTTWDTVYFTLNDRTVWHSDGYTMGATQVMSEAGRPFYADELRPVNNNLYASGNDNGGDELWIITP